MKKLKYGWIILIDDMRICLSWKPIRLDEDRNQYKQKTHKQTYGEKHNNL